MTIHFKNGETKNIIPEIAKSIADLMLNAKNVTSFQVFKDQNENILLILQMSEITYID